MAVTVMMWNVETFGDAWPASRGPAYVPLCNLMAKVLYGVGADVLILMELRSGGVAYLPTLAAALVTESGGAGHVWNYDYIPGSVLAGNNYPIGNPAHLGYTQQGHAEGYAVLWRNHPEFTVLGTRVALSGNPVGGQSHIGLVFTGRTSGPNAPNPYWYTAPNFNPAAVPAPWPQLDFPEPNPVHHGDTRWDLCRRPCCVVLDLVRPNAPVPRADELLPIVVHHATNHPYSTDWSVQSAAYSAPLYQVDDTTQAAPTMITVNQALTGGDYNIDHNAPNGVGFGAYDYFTDGFAGAGPGKGGANLGTTWVDSMIAGNNETAVRVNDRRDQPIIGGTVAAYRWLAIDNVFVRNLNTIAAANYRGPVVNLLTALRQQGWLVNSPGKRAVIRSFRTALMTELGAALPGGGYTNYPYIEPISLTPCRSRKRARDGSWLYSGRVIANITHFNNYLADLNRGRFTNARRVAEFYFNSVSDHLPVVLSFTV